jgi:hypothetical protein
MIRDDIIRMAREAKAYQLVDANEGSMICISQAQLEHFAALVRSDEREACAKVVMTMRGKCWAYDHDVIAEAIQARGQA